MPGQLFEGKSLAQLFEQKRLVRVVGRGPLWASAVRDVLQTVQRKAVGNSVQRAGRRLCRTADSQVLAGGGGGECSVSAPRGAAQNARRSLRLSAKRDGLGVCENGRARPGQRRRDSSAMSCSPRKA